MWKKLAFNRLMQKPHIYKLILTVPTSSPQERYYTAPFKSLKVVSSEKKKKKKIILCTSLFWIPSIAPKREDDLDYNSLKRTAQMNLMDVFNETDSDWEQKENTASNL